MYVCLDEYVHEWTYVWMCVHMCADVCGIHSLSPPCPVATSGEQSSCSLGHSQRLDDDHSGPHPQPSRTAFHDIHHQASCPDPQSRLSHLVLAPSARSYLISTVKQISMCTTVSA